MAHRNFRGEGMDQKQISFKNDPKLKQFYVDRALQHQQADEIIQGKYWVNGKGCCVGCLAHEDSNAHRILAKATDVPRWIYVTADRIHEGLPLEDAKKWPVRFIKSLPVGVDLNDRLSPWLIIVVESTLDKFDHAENPECKKVVDNILELLRNGVTDPEKLRAVANAVYAAANAAYAAANAAYAAAYAVANATYAVTDAAYAADYAAYAAANAAYAAAKQNRQKQWQYFADKFVELLRSKDVPTISKN